MPYLSQNANVSAKILSENINIKPVISILAGTRIMISPLQDIWFRTIDGTVTIQPLDKKSLLN
jgi:type IV secretory pathway VirB10-like protein